MVRRRPLVRPRRSIGGWACVAVLTIVSALLTACTGNAASPIAPAALSSPLGGSGAGRPNIVYVLTDDLAWNLVRYMPHVQALEKAGTTFTNYTVTDSLCCPSRSSIFTGEFPHDTGVYNNHGIDGGFDVFHRLGDEQRSFAVDLHRAGYRTALIGKYLNDYIPSRHYDGDSETVGRGSGPATWVPPGWSTWAGTGWGYEGYGYDVNFNHRVRHFGRAAKDYTTRVFSRVGKRFIRNSASAHKPFMLEVSTFSPHQPYVPARQDANSFPNVRAPRTPAFNTLPKHAPAWLRDKKPLDAAEIAAIDADFRLRVQDVQSVDRMIGGLEKQVAAEGLSNNTVFVFNSDNGLHMGEYRLKPGKLTAFDTDVRVPLIMAGPSIPAGRVDDALVQNIDIAPTFDAIAGATVPPTVDGHSMLPLLLGHGHVPWRRAALIEHHGPDLAKVDPDYQTHRAGNPTSYEAIRTKRFTYVLYANGQREYYDRARDPYELDNIAGSLSPQRIAALDQWVSDLQDCHGIFCWTASRPTDIATAEQESPPDLTEVPGAVGN